MGPINRLPTALLSIVDISPRGNNPTTLKDDVQPTLDLMDQYLLSATRTWQLVTTLVVGAASIGAPIPITNTNPTDLAQFIVGTGIQVPQDEAWYISRAVQFWQLPADATAYADASLDFAFVNMPTLLTGFTTGVAAGGRFGQRHLQRPFWLPPGARYQPVHIGAFGGAGNVDFSGGGISLARFRV